MLLPLPRGATEMERFGETGRSSENRMDDVGGDEPYMLTRGGDADRWRKVVDREEKPVEDEAKAEADEERGED